MAAPTPSIGQSSASESYMPLFAAQSDIGPAFLFAYLAGSGLAILLGSLFQAILLMLAARLVRLPDVRYGRAWSAAVIGNVVCYGLLAVMAVGLAVGMAEDGTRSIRGSYMFLASPTNFIYLFVGATLVHTLLFS